jgi:hypothetical protein
MTALKRIACISNLKNLMKISITQVLQLFIYLFINFKKSAIISSFNVTIVVT